MKSLPFALMSLAGAAVVAGCSVPLSRLDLPARNPGTQDVGTPPSWVAHEPKTHYYMDERGIVWDDKGMKRDPATLPLAGQPQDTQREGTKS